MIKIILIQLFIFYVRQCYSKTCSTEGDLSSIKINVTEYPLIRKNTSIVETIGGIQVTDPYRYLEDLKSTETINFIKQLNSTSDCVLKKSKYREKIKEKIKENERFERHEIYEKHGDYYYFNYYPSQSKVLFNLYRQKTLDGEKELFFDYIKTYNGKRPFYGFKKFDKDGTLFVYSNVTSYPHGKIKFKKSNGETLNEELENIGVKDVNFVYKNTSLLYISAFNNTLLGTDITTVPNYAKFLYYHKMGTQQSEDVLITYASEPDTFIDKVHVSNDERYLFITFSSTSKQQNTIYYYDLRTVCNKQFKGIIKLKPLFTKWDATYEIIDSDEEEAIVLTNKNAYYKKIIKVKLSEGDKGEWKTLIDQIYYLDIRAVNVAGIDYLIVTYLNVKLNIFDAYHYVYYKHDGKLLQKIDLNPCFGDQISATPESNEFFAYLSNPMIPGIIYRGNLDDIKCKGEVTFERVYVDAPFGFDIQSISYKQVFYKSADGIELSMYLMYRNDMQLNSNNPVLLEAHEWHRDAAQNYYYSSILSFVRNFGGIWAIATIRGGDSIGWERTAESIYRDKNTTFNDVFSAASYLISNKYTNPSKLSVTGSYFGGMVMAVAIQQRPELFGAMIINRGTFDMVRYAQLTYDENWNITVIRQRIGFNVNSYVKFSPYHQLKMFEKPTQWPPTLLIASSTDMKASSSHTLKYTARLYDILQVGIEYQTNPVIATIMDKDYYYKTSRFTHYFEDNLNTIAFIQQLFNLEWKD